MTQVSKLYLAQAHTTANIKQVVNIELHGTVNLTIYGSEDQETNIADISDMTPISDPILEEGHYPFYTLPKYIAFIGTADKIFVSGYDLTEIKDIS